MKTFLAGTFTEADSFPKRQARDIYEKFSPQKIFVFGIKEGVEISKYLLTYNVKQEQKDKALTEFKKKYRNTIILQRNSYNNTLYTINSLNEIVKKQNNGVLSESFRVDWRDYKNSVVLSDSRGNIRKLSIELLDIIEL